LIAFVVALALSVPTAAPNWTIVRNGKSDYRILIEPSSSRSMRHGAEELQFYIEQISGAKLPITWPKKGWSDLGRHSIVLADSQVLALAGSRHKFGTEEYRIKTGKSGIVIVGNAKRGVMYVCFAFLEVVLGVRWYNSRVTKVPRKKTIAVPALDVQGKPAFEYREPFMYEAFDGAWAAHNRTNGNAQQLDASVGGKVSYGPFVHTFAEICPPEKYFATHPEYFSMIDGKRMNGYYQLCLTNPAVLQLAIDKVEQWTKDYPNATIFSVSQNDTYYNCQCPDCAAVEKEEGAPSGPLIRFVNKVAEAVEKKHPSILIDTLAYQWSEKPPLHVRPRTNVRIRIAPIGACFSHPLDGCNENATPLKNLKDWANITGNIYIWHYTTNFANYLQPLPNLDEIAGDTLLFKKNGVVGFFDEGGYAAGGGAEMSGLKSYLLAKLMWDPSRKPQPIIEDYLQGVYGKAAPFISKWLDLVHASGRQLKSHARIYDPPTAPYLNDEVLAEGDKLFTAAESAVVSDPVALDEVKRAKLSLEYVQVMRTPRTDQKWAALASTVAEKIKRFGITQIREGEDVGQFLKRIGQG
jgi:hypothetical protein